MHSVSIILHTLPWLRIVKDMHQHKLTVIMLLFAYWNIYFIPTLPPSPNPECESYLSNVSQENPKERCRRGTGDSILPEYAVLPSRVSAKKTKRLQCIFEFVVSCFNPNVRISQNSYLVILIMFVHCCHTVNYKMLIYTL